MSQTIQKEQIQEWEQKILAPILRGEFPSENEIQQLGGLAILSADTDKIKEYVFESAKLPEIRGASMILDDLNQGGMNNKGANIRKLFAIAGFSVNPDNDNSCIIYAGGGSLLALVPLEMNGVKIAEMLCAEIETLFPEQTGKATITCVITPWKLGVSFADAVKLAGVALRRAKEEKTVLPFFESHPLVRRCASCRWRPAMRFERDPDGLEVARCRICSTKMTVGRGQKSRWHDQFESQYQVSALSAVDLDDIAKHSNGYVGFVYADANSLGDWLNEAQNASDYRQRSHAVHESVTEAVYKAIFQHLGPLFDRKFEVITIGGDDALLIVPAGWALAIARDVCREFTIKMCEQGYPNRTMSAGVVIANDHTPVYFLRRMAESLLKSAKAEVKQQGTVDFLVLKTQSMLGSDLVHLRGTEPWSIQDSFGPAQLALSHGPYSLEELDKLLELVQGGRSNGFPRSQLYALRQALGHGRFSSILFFLYQQRRGKKAVRTLMEDYQKHFSPAPPNDIIPWQRLSDRRGKQQYRTAWADLVEIWNFAKEGSHARTD